MRIKRIEVIGFKSFCDRAVLNFGEPIVGVVGPNGCGKSNIVDAIRWCMGEQSAKQLRGAAMGDVIFNGSDSRGMAGMAEVSLTFEDVGFSQETLDNALHEEDAFSEPLPQGDTSPGEAATDEEPTDGDAEEAPLHRAPTAEEEAVAADKRAMEKLAQLAQEHDEQENKDSKEQGQGETAGEGDGEAAPEEDPYQATKEAAAILMDKPPVLDFAKYSEVTITRRLFRDGTSSYFLNKTPCRLRDVTDFFLGTGVGTKAYSIIEQGRIGMIVSSRAGDRRHIIEEAAGITKFKTKKRAAERKLDQTRQNLLRVSDIVAELAKRLGSLRRQAQKAERYRRYKAEIKDIELWMASHDLLGYIALDQTLQSSLTELSKQAASARVDLEAKDGLVLSERESLAILERELAARKEQIYELENRIRLSESKVDFQTREAGELTVRCEANSEEVERLVRQVTSDAQDLESQRGELEEIEQEVAARDANAAERLAALDKAREVGTEVQNELDETRRLIEQARADVGRAEVSKESLTGRVSDAQERLERVLEETEAVEKRAKEREQECKTLESKLAELVQAKLDLGNKSEELAASKVELEEELNNAEASVETLRTQVHRRRSRLQSLREIHEKYEGFARGTRAVMQHSDNLAAKLPDSEIRGLVADVVNAPEKLEVAVEAALGDRLGGILVNKAEVGAHAIEYLKETSAGRSAFVPFRTPLSQGGGIEFEDRSLAATTTQSMERRIPAQEGVLGSMVDLVTFADGYKDVATNLLGDTVVVESLAQALRLRALGVTHLLVTLDGDIVDQRGVVVGGSREAEGASVLAQKREIRELDEIVASLETELTAATAHLVATKGELLKVNKAIEGIRNERHGGELAITSHEKDLAGARAELATCRNRLARLNKEQLDLDDRLGALRHEAVIMSELFETASADLAKHESVQLGLIDRVQKAREAIDAASLVLTEAKVRVAQIGEKRASLEASTLRLEKSHQDLSSRIETLTASIEGDKSRAAELMAESDALKEELVSLREDKEVRHSELAERRSGYEERLSVTQRTEVEVRHLRGQVEELTQRCTDLDVRLGKLASDRAHLEETMLDRYHVQLCDVVCEYHLRPCVGAEDKERLQQRRSVVERMGADINLTAIEEFQSLSERHDFLSTQQVDLERAVEQLDSAIQKINETSRRLFRETYHAINNKFQEMFPKLFRGGRARLSLTGGEGIDILEAGVEIHAQPPGKKNATVDQLSGGEKALTAVALLFSIFLIKPSPFCLLDEVDAPLDEANVDRYNEILREMSGRSQFIVITHNKRTMACADRLYGVTMQEPGVSKLVTVNLNKVGANTQAA